MMKRNCSGGATRSHQRDSHLGSMLLGSSESIPVVDGALVLGQWQSVMMVDLDGRDRSWGSVLGFGYSGNLAPWRTGRRRVEMGTSAECAERASSRRCGATSKYA